MVEICNVGPVDNSFAPISMNLASGDVVMIHCQDRHKRVLFDVFSGYEKRFTGKILYEPYNWLDISDDKRSILNRRYVGIASPKYPLLGTLSMRENISMPLLLDGYKMNSINISTIIQELKLQKCIDEFPSEISLSEYLRGICARAFVEYKKIVIMDDLYADLSIDEKGSSKLLTYWLAKKLNVTLIYITSIQEKENFSDIEYIEEDGNWKKNPMELKMDEKTLNQLIEQVEMKISDKELPMDFDNIDIGDEDIVKIVEMLKKISTLFAETLSGYIDLLYKERKKNQDLGDNLRNPLAIIKGNVDILTIKAHTEQERARFDIIKQNLDRIEKILEHRKL